MKSKKLTLTLSLFAGSSGADRFYLGQNNAGWLVLLTFWVLIPGGVYAVAKFNLFPNWEPFLLGRFALPILFHLFASGRYLLMNDEKFKSQDQSKSNTLPLTIGSIVITILLIIAGNRLLATVIVPDLTNAEVSANLSAETMSQEFLLSEENFRKKYDNSVLQIEGIVNTVEMDFEAGKVLILNGTEGDNLGIRCYFAKEEQEKLEQIKPTDRVIIVGLCDGFKLDPSKIISINGKKITELNN